MEDETYPTVYILHVLSTHNLILPWFISSHFVKILKESQNDDKSKNGNLRIPGLFHSIPQSSTNYLISV